MIVQLVNQWNISGFKSAKLIDSELPLFPKRYWYEFWKRPSVYNLQENNVPTGHIMLSCIYGCKEKPLNPTQWGQRTIYVSLIHWTGPLGGRRGTEDEMMPRGCSQDLVQDCSLLTPLCKASCPHPSQTNTDQRAAPAHWVLWVPVAVTGPAHRGRFRCSFLWE